MLSDIPIEYERNSSKNVNPARINTKLTVDAGIFWEAALETPFALMMSNIALNAWPELNIMNRPIGNPARGMNMARQSKKLFRKMLGAKLLVAWPWIRVWFTWSFTICSSWGLSGTRTPTIVTKIATMKMKRVE